MAKIGAFHYLTRLAALALLVVPAAAQNPPNPTCLNQNGGNSCSAQDVRVAIVIAQQITDACVDLSTDTATIDILADVTAGPTRYDIGLWLALQGTSAFDGTECLHEFLPVPPYTDLEASAGLDICGDLAASTTVQRAIFDLEIPCKDEDRDGQLDLAACTSWANSSDPTDCTTLAEAIPETGAKCFCDDVIATGVSAPNLTLVKGCTPDEVVPGGTISCTIAVINDGLGTAVGVTFEDDYPEDYGTTSNLVASGLPCTAAADADPCTDDGTFILFEPGPIAPGTGFTLSYDFTVFDAASLPNGNAIDTFTNTVSTYYTNNLGQRLLQPLTASDTTTTPVELQSFLARWDAISQTYDLRWTTATEIGNVGFNVYLQTDLGLRRLNDAIIPSQVVDSTTKVDYQLSLPADAPGQLVIEDLDARGGRRWHGPFFPGKPYGPSLGVAPIDWDSVRAEHRGKRLRREAAARSALGEDALEARAARARSGKKAARGTKVGHPALELQVRRDGLYRLTYEAALAAGLDLEGVPTDEISLVSQGRPHPIFVRPATASSGRFGPGGFVEFLGRQRRSLYGDTNVYFLRRDRAAARPVATLDATPRDAAAALPWYRARREIAAQNHYSFASPTDDPWFDTRMLAVNGPLELTKTIDIDQLADSGNGASTLTVETWGGSDYPIDPDHHLVVALNGQVLADERFNGLESRVLRLAVPPGLLRAGANSVTLRLPHDSGTAADLINLERVAIDYPRAFVAEDDSLTFESTTGGRVTISGFSEPGIVVYQQTSERLERLSGVVVESDGGEHSATFEIASGPARYLATATSAFLTPEPQPAQRRPKLGTRPAEYLIIAHPDFLGSSLDRLARYRRSDGYSVDTVTTEAIYAHYSHGLVEPEAIRSYIREAARQRETRMVLLVGGDTYDYHDYLGSGSLSFLPSLYRQTDSIVRYSPVDAAYADLDDDGIQDLAIGRLPVRTSDELAAAIDKTLKYEENDYRSTLLMVADEQDPRSGRSFVRDGEESVQAFAERGWLVERAYLDPPLGTDLQSARRLLMTSFNEGLPLRGNDLSAPRTGGVGLVWFRGHSGPRSWTLQGLFTSGDALALGNRDAPSIVAQWGCWNTYYVSPTEDTLGHSLMLNPQGGAAAVIGASTLTDAEAEQILARLVDDHLARPGLTLGEALLAAKQELAASHPDETDVLLGFSLLGDPALRLLR